VVVGKAASDYAIFLYFARLHVRSIIRNMLTHLAFLVAALVATVSISTLPVLIACGLALLAANLGLSLHDSSDLRQIVRKTCVRLALISS
jgi:sorbitol-specific phosphotransferase system component IIBC